MDKKLAKVTNASLEIKDRGILNFWILVDYEDGGSQGVGGIALDHWSEDKQSRVGTAFGCEVIRSLLIEFDVNDLHEMKGQHIWVIGEGEGMSFIPKGVKALSIDNPKSKGVVFDNILDEFKDE